MKSTSNYKKVNIDPLSYVPIPLDLYYSETKKLLGSGTGFIYEMDNKNFIITNWHVVTGLNPNTKKPISSNAGIPDLINFPIIHHRKPFIKWTRFDRKLYDNLGKATWLVHPSEKEKIDVVAIEVNIEEDANPVAINKQEFDEEFNLDVSDDVFILGYPYKLKGGGNFPIWKRGSIASEPDLDYDGVPKMLIDTASRPGMSGAPVIFKRTGVHGLVDGKFANNSIIGTIQGFVGVYSGRIVSSSELEAQLGIIWKKQVIEEIISGNTMDTIRL